MKNYFTIFWIFYFLVALIDVRAQQQFRIDQSPTVVQLYSNSLFFTADGKLLVGLASLSAKEPRAWLYLWDAESGRLLLSRSTQGLGNMYDVNGFIPDYNNNLLFLQVPGGGVSSKAIDLKSLNIVGLPANVKSIVDAYKNTIPTPLLHPKNVLLPDKFYAKSFSPCKRVALVQSTESGKQMLYDYEQQTLLNIPFVSYQAEWAIFSPSLPVAVFQVAPNYIVWWNWETNQTHFLAVGNDLQHLTANENTFQVYGYFDRPGIIVNNIRFVFEESQADVSDKYGIAIVAKSATGKIGIFDLKAMRLLATIVPENYVPAFKKNFEPLFCQILHVRVINDLHSIAVLQYKTSFSQLDGGKPHSTEIVKINNTTGKIEGRLTLPKDPWQSSSFPSFPYYRFESLSSADPLIAVSSAGDKKNVYVVNLTSMKISKQVAGTLLATDSVLYYYDDTNLYKLHPKTFQQQTLYTSSKDKKLENVAFSSDRKKIAYTFPDGKAMPEIGIYQPPRSYVIADLQAKKDTVIKSTGSISYNLTPYFYDNNTKLGYAFNDRVKGTIALPYYWNGNDYYFSTTYGSIAGGLPGETVGKTKNLFTSDFRWGNYETQYHQIQFRGPFVLWFGRDDNPKFYDLEKQFLYRFIVNKDADQFLILRSDGYYCGNPELLRNYYIVDGYATYGIEQFDASLNRPDVIYNDFPFKKKSFSSLLEKIVAVRQQQLSSHTTFTLTNVAEIVVQQRVVKATPNGDVAEITIAPANSSLPPAFINVFADGVPVFGKQGIPFKPQSNNTMTVTVPLLFGENKIEVSGKDNNGNESRRTEFVLRSTTKPKQPVFLGIHIGVSTFQDTSYNLTYAVKDAKDLSQQISLKDFISEKILLTNEQVTREGILKLQKRLHSTSVHDIVLLTVASHGILDTSLTYYIAGYDMDFTEPSKRGIPYSLFEELLDGIPARRKIFMIDACNSGENIAVAGTFQPAKTTTPVASGIKTRGFKRIQTVSEEFSQQRLRQLLEQFFPEVRRSAGAMVISAAGAQECALESGQWKNGVFTYAVLQGIVTMNADVNKDKQLMMREVKEYVYREVPRLTNGIQNPASRLDNIRLDVKIK